jgi:hypothetical protein
MSRGPIAALLTVLIATAGVALAETAPAESHDDHPQKVISLGASRISPTRLTMSTGDVLAFQNYTANIMQVIFLEPPRLGQTVQCKQIERVAEDAAITPGALFKRRGDQVVALIAPGAFVSVCGLPRGNYVFSAAPFTPQMAGERLGQRGQIVVE